MEQLEQLEQIEQKVKIMVQKFNGARLTQDSLMVMRLKFEKVRCIHYFGRY